MNAVPDMNFVITIMGSSKYIISQGIITLTAFIVGIGAGVLIHHYLSKLPMKSMIIIFIYIVSFVSSVLYLLEAFGKLDAFLLYLRSLFT